MTKLTLLINKFTSLFWSVSPLLWFKSQYPGLNKYNQHRICGLSLYLNLVILMPQSTIFRELPVPPRAGFRNVLHPKDSFVLLPTISPFPASPTPTPLNSWSFHKGNVKNPTPPMTSIVTAVIQASQQHGRSDAYTAKSPRMSKSENRLDQLATAYLWRSVVSKVGVAVGRRLWDWFRRFHSDGSDGHFRSEERVCARVKLVEKNSSAKFDLHPQKVLVGHDSIFLRATWFPESSITY